MELLLYLIGAAATLVLIINNITRTALRHKDLRLIEIAIIFFVVLLPSAALLVNNLNNALFDTLENLMLLLIIPLAIFSVGLTVVELFRPERLRQSRGLLGFGAAILLAVATFSYNLVSLNAQNNAVQQNRVPTPVNSNDDINICEVTFQNIFIDLVNQIAVQTGLSIEELFAAVEEQPDLSIASLIEANGGQPSTFLQSLISQTQTTVQDLLARGCIDASQATAIIGGLPFFLPDVIYNDFAQLQNLMGQNTDPNIDPTDLQTTRIALVATLNQEPSPLPSLTNTPTATRTTSPTPTRTPRLEDTATPTLPHLVTNTPTATPTLPNPCLATADFNVNMRSYPDLEESEVVLTIPYEASITIYAPNEDKTWWFGLYEGETGWVSSEFIRLTNACNDLPPRRP